MSDADYERGRADALALVVDSMIKASRLERAVHAMITASEVGSVPAAEAAWREMRAAVNREEKSPNG